MKTPAELLACAKRELAMRKNAYPRWVKKGSLSPQSAEHEIECMQEIVKILNGIDDAQQELEIHENRT
jgi:hypothetical protein